MSKIIVIGDSLLKGVIYDEKEKKHMLLKKSGINQLIEHGYTLENYAKFGLTIEKAKRIIEQDTLETNSKIILEIGGNDCDYNWDEVSRNPYGIHQTKTPLDIFEVELSGLIERLITQGITPVLVSIPPLDHNLFYNFISENRDKDSILSFLGTKRKIYEHQKAYNEVILKLANAYQVEVIPLREAVEQQGDVESLYCLDGMHLNEKGQGLIYETFKSHLDKTTNRNF